MIGRRSSGRQDARKDRGGAPVVRVPLFNLDEIHERRILSWSPEPVDELEGWEVEQVEDAPPAEPVAWEEPRVPEVRERTERLHEVEPRRPELAPRRPEVEVRRPMQVPPPAPGNGHEPVRNGGSEVHEPASSEVERETTAAATAVPMEQTPRRRGRPRGRPRRQVHFHVDPDEEQLLMAAVQTFGSQQKGLIAALESLQQVEALRDEIERLEAEVDHQRRLLDEAESLFRRLPRLSDTA